MAWLFVVDVTVMFVRVVENMSNLLSHLRTHHPTQYTQIPTTSTEGESNNLRTRLHLQQAKNPFLTKVQKDYRTILTM